MITGKQFDLRDVLSITTKRILSKDGIEGVHRVLGYMECQSFTDFELPAAGDRCRPVLLKLFPQLSIDNLKTALADLDLRLTSSGNRLKCINGWVEELTIKFGTTLDVPTMSDLKKNDSQSSNLSAQGVLDEIQKIRQQGLKVPKGLEL